MAKQPELDDLQTEVLDLRQQVETLTGVLAERDKEAGRMIEAIAHLSARAFNTEFLLQQRKSSGRGLDQLTMAPGLSIDTYRMVYDEVVKALRAK